MNFYSHRTVEEQKNRLPEAFQANYERTQLDRIELFDGKEVVEVLGYFEYSFLEEKSYTEQPVRSNDGSIEDIDNYKTFLTPRLIIKYNMMGIDDYRTLMKKLKENNGIILMCYDIVEDKRVKHEMYFAPPSMPIIYQKYLMALGIQEYSIEMIGTNTRSKKKFYLNADSFDVDAGMTWEEWVDSDYNDSPSDNYISGDYVYVYGSRLSLSNGGFVSPKDFILYDGYYSY